MAKRDDGTECPVVQDFTYGKYLGNLKLTFDENGKLLSAKGNPIMLNASYAEDPTGLQMVDEMDEPIIKARTVRTFTQVVLVHPIIILELCKMEASVFLLVKINSEVFSFKIECYDLTF